MLILRLEPGDYVAVSETFTSLKIIHSATSRMIRCHTFQNLIFTVKFEVIFVSYKSFSTYFNFVFSEIWHYKIVKWIPTNRNI